MKNTWRVVERILTLKLKMFSNAYWTQVLFFFFFFLVFWLGFCSYIIFVLVAFHLFLFWNLNLGTHCDFMNSISQLQWFDPKDFSQINRNYCCRIKNLALNPSSYYYYFYLNTMITCNHHKIKFISFKSYIIYILKNKNKTTTIENILV